MPSLWLTYAWKDNADQDVDHIIHELEKAALTVRYDRAELLAGQRLWQQIDAAMSDPDVDAWAIFVTENSLKSEACQEEIAYALDRALRSNAEFPLIGIFPRPLDRAIIPSAIATRLYVDLTSANWQQQVVDGVRKAKTASAAPAPSPVGFTISDFGEGKAVEVWPRSGRWYPFLAGVPANEGDKLKSVMSGPRGAVTGTGIVHSSEKETNGQFVYQGVYHVVDANNSGHVFLGELPSKLLVGQEGQPLFEITFRERSQILTGELAEAFSRTFQYGSSNMKSGG